MVGRQEVQRLRARFRSMINRTVEKDLVSRDCMWKKCHYDPDSRRSRFARLLYVNTE